jgi:hypothetical protein
LLRKPGRKRQLVRPRHGGERSIEIISKKQGDMAYVVSSGSGYGHFLAVMNTLVNLRVQKMW